MPTRPRLMLNIDPLREDFFLPELVATGVQGVRLVVRPGMHDVLAGLRASGIYVLGMVGKESIHPFDSRTEAAEWYRREYGAWIHEWQIGNEAEIWSESSWTMDQAEWIGLAAAFGACQPQLGPGLASGDPGKAIVAPYAPVCIHYPLGNQKVDEYLLQFPNRGVLVTEGYTDHRIRRELLRRPDGKVLSYADWWHNPLLKESGLGVQRYPERLALFQEDIKEFAMADPTIAELVRRIAQLEEQQGLQTEALFRLGQGLWRGGIESFQAILNRLNADRFQGATLDKVVDFPKA